MIALILIIAFQADVTALIQLYIVGVFVSFTFSQLGMIRHWNRLLRTERDPPARRRMRRSQTINAIGFCFTAVVLVIVLITKFLAGAWIAILAMAIIFVTMRAIKQHYDRVAREIAADEDDLVLPSRVHSIVLVSKLHLPTMRALAFARATRPDSLEAVTVNVDPEDTADLAREWEDRQIPVALKVIDSPFREITKPVLDYVTPRPQGLAARHRHGLHPRVRGRALVGAPAAQPVRAAAQGPAAVHPRGDGDLGALAAVVVRGAGRTDPATGGTAARRSAAGCRAR